MMLPPALSTMPSMRPSTWSGTPDSMCSGGSPRRFGQLLRTRSWLAPMPPDVTITACAFSAKSPTTVREERAPRSTLLGSSTSPRTPSTTPPLVVSVVHPMAEAQRDEAGLRRLAHTLRRTAR